MNLLLKSAKLIHAGHAFNGKTFDIYIEDGIYKKIASAVAESDCKKDTQIINAAGLSVSIGWLDMRCRFGEPGAGTERNYHFRTKCRICRRLYGSSNDAINSSATLYPIISRIY